MASDQGERRGNSEGVMHLGFIGQTRMTELDAGLECLRIRVHALPRTRC
jgi:hypothetical protein